MRHNTDRMRRVPSLFGGQAAPKRQDSLIDSFSVIVSLYLKIPVERRSVSIREADANEVHS